MAKTIQTVTVKTHQGNKTLFIKAHRTIKYSSHTERQYSLYDSAKITLGRIVAKVDSEFNALTVYGYEIRNNRIVKNFGFTDNHADMFEKIVAKIADRIDPWSANNSLA